MTEALKLWQAEALSVNTGRIAASWGCVALPCNPERTVPEGILNARAEREQREFDYGRVSQTDEEGWLISKEGLLQIDWPRRMARGAPLDLDLLLVTANDPTLTGTPPSYPGVGMIVDAWNGAAPGYAEYFWKNVDHGITTFQDEEIRAGLIRGSRSQRDTRPNRKGLYS